MLVQLPATVKPCIHFGNYFWAVAQGTIEGIFHVYQEIFREMIKRLDSIEVPNFDIYWSMLLYRLVRATEGTEALEEYNRDEIRWKRG